MATTMNDEGSEVVSLESFGYTGAAVEKLIRGQSTNTVEGLLQAMRAMMAAHSIQEIIGHAGDYLHAFVSFDCLGCVLRKSDFVTSPPSAKLDAAPNLEFITGTLEVELIDDDGLAQSAPAVMDLSALSEYFPKTASRMERSGIQSCCSAAIGFGDKQFGRLILGREDAGGFPDSALSDLGIVATVLAFVLDHVVAVELTRQNQLMLADDRGRLQMVQQVTEAVVSELDLRKLLYKVSESIREILKVEYSDLLLYNPAKMVMQRLAVSYKGKGLMKEDYDEPLCSSPAHRAFQLRQPVVCQRVEMEELAHQVEAMGFFLEEGLQETCSIPLITQGRVLGTLNASSSDVGKFTPSCVSLLSEIGRPIAMAVDNALAYKEISELRDRLASEKEYLEGEIRKEGHFGEIVGESAALKSVLDQVETVADSGASVLILGETGTGKELIARALHDLSTRKNRTFVKFNCAAMPAGLMESELFGHERGAFTGAIAAKAGLMEVANKGTLFLDEIGDIPPELQPKLLRVLQDQQFSRLGSTRTIQVDVRVIAATNRNLEQMIADRQFRSDLYYRLNVFPICLPPLRERREDIPLLIRHFVQKYNKKLNRDVKTIPSETLSRLTQMPWFGNIRELEHLIERSLILSRGSMLQVPLELSGQFFAPSVPSTSLAVNPKPEVNNLEDVERNHILSVLQKTRGVVGGTGGAASILGIKRTTLLAKMQRLGIVRDLPKMQRQ